jgi:hypothetical protein
MNILQFMSDSPILTVVVVYILAEFIFKLWNRTLRHWNIRKHGYPQSHCDADGDIV